MNRRRLLIFAAVVVAAVAAGLVTVSRAARQADRGATGHADTPPGPPAGSSVQAGTQETGGAGRLPDGPQLGFRSTARDERYGRLGFVGLDDTASRQETTALECAVTDVATDVGICLHEDFSFFEPYTALIFDKRLEVRHTVRLEGKPSRTRLSPDGRLASATVFVTGHSYAAGNFSTATTIIDIATGRVLGNLEDFEVSKDGAPFRRPDFNLWGVTFTEIGNRFYATLASGGKTFLVEGDLAARRLVTVRENVECPSLSPDGRRIAYKHRIGDSLPVRWRLHVLDLASGTDIPLAETRNVDDQAEWLDDRTVLYTMPTDDPAVTAVHATPADGSGSPRLVRSGAASPAVLRRS